MTVRRTGNAVPRPPAPSDTSKSEGKPAGNPAGKVPGTEPKDETAAPEMSEKATPQERSARERDVAFRTDLDRARLRDWRPGDPNEPVQSLPDESKGIFQSTSDQSRTVFTNSKAKERKDDAEPDC